MALIRKRLRVEMWMYERLQELYGAVRFMIKQLKIRPYLLNYIVKICNDLQFQYIFF
jgi:hypothetical protein